MMAATKASKSVAHSANLLGKLSAAMLVGWWEMLLERQSVAQWVACWVDTLVAMKVHVTVN